jgi:hypothetical protein
VVQRDHAVTSLKIFTRQFMPACRLSPPTRY